MLHGGRHHPRSGALSHRLPGRRGGRREADLKGSPSPRPLIAVLTHFRTPGPTERRILAAIASRGARARVVDPRRIVIDERGYFWQPGRDGLVGVEIDIVMSRAEVCEIRRPFDPRIVKAYVNFLQACRNRDIATVNGHPFLLEVCQDKHLSHLVVEEVLREHGVHNPRTLFFASRKALERTLPALRFPLVLKDPYGTLGRGIHPVADAGELAGRLAGRHFPLLLQELVEKTCNDQGEYLATRVVVGREPLGERPIVLCFYTQCSRSFTTNLGDGGRVGRGAADPALLACSLAILERVQADLLAVDYLIDSRGRRVFLEINHAPGTSEQTLELKPDLWERVVELGIERWRRGFRLPLPASVTGPPQAGD